MHTATTMTRSNRDLFIPRDTGSPKDSLMTHLSTLGRLARLDFERCAVAGEVIFAVAGDAVPTSQQDEEARIGTLTYALKKLGNAEDAAEFTRCLNAICEDGDARSRQTTASHYYREIAGRGVGVVLKEMGLLAMQLAGLTPVVEEGDSIETSAGSEASGSSAVNRNECEPNSEDHRPLFDQEVERIARLVSGRRKSARIPHDDFTEWLGDLEAGGASVEDLDDAFLHLEAMDQYDEGGAVVVMSSHERTFACGRVDPEFTAEDLPERVRHLAGQLRRDYAGGVGAEEMWDDLSAQIEVAFPVTGRTESGGRFYSHANRELQQLTVQVLEALLADCAQDFHLTALRTNRTYRRFHKAVRGAADTKTIGELMKQAYEARQSGALPLKHFTTLKTAADLQRVRLQSARLSQTAHRLIQEINSASGAKLRFLSWALYGNNQPDHPVHTLSNQEQTRIWEALKSRKGTAAADRDARDRNQFAQRHHFNSRARLSHPQAVTLIH
jgi:hypothetical protein